jgi:hypothetical protein
MHPDVDRNGDAGAFGAVGLRRPVEAANRYLADARCWDGVRFAEEFSLMESHTPNFEIEARLPSQSDRWREREGIKISRLSTNDRYATLTL